jgi:hypothetical protein
VKIDFETDGTWLLAEKLAAKGFNMLDYLKTIVDTETKKAPKSSPCTSSRT